MLSYRPIPPLALERRLKIRGQHDQMIEKIRGGLRVKNWLKIRAGHGLHIALIEVGRRA